MALEPGTSCSSLTLARAFSTTLFSFAPLRLYLSPALIFISRALARSILKREGKREEPVARQQQRERPSSDPLFAFCQRDVGSPPSSPAFFHLLLSLSRFSSSLSVLARVLREYPGMPWGMITSSPWNFNCRRAASLCARRHLCMYASARSWDRYMRESMILRIGDGEGDRAFVARTLRLLCDFSRLWLDRGFGEYDCLCEVKRNCFHLNG